MTTEPSNGSANDDQRCYIERLEQIEKAAQGLIANPPTCAYFTHLEELRAALEANQ